ncbi:MerR family DNA-binding protein [Paraburkholderia sediminicola]
MKRSQSLGFSPDEVEALLSLHDGQTCNSARAIAEHKLADVRQRIQDLSMLEAALAKLLDVERQGFVSAHRRTHGRRRTHSRQLMQPAVLARLVCSP